MNESNDYSGGGRTEIINSLEKSFIIVETLKNLNGGRIHEIADHTNLTTSTVYKHLNTLLKNDYVNKNGVEYHLSFKYLEMGGYVREQFVESKMIEDKINDISDETKETAHFTTIDNGRPVILYVSRGEKGVHTRAHVGTRLYMHQVAAGKAMLAQLPESEVMEIIDRYGLPKATEKTITDKTVLFDELEAIREQGVAFNREESAEGLRTVAAPLILTDEGVVGAFTIAAPSNRLQGQTLETDFPEVLRNAVNELELNIKYRPN